jgi:hypothetical protein
MEIKAYKIDDVKRELSKQKITLIEDIKNDKQLVYNYIIDNPRNLLGFVQNPYSFLEKRDILKTFDNIYETDDKKTIQKKIYDQIHLNNNFCRCCNKPTKFISILRGYTKTCISPICISKLSSDRMRGDLNSCHKMSEETKNNAKMKQSIKMKESIKNGSFTPPITNSWANSRVKIKIDGTSYMFRSTWECMFWLLTKHDYETVRIPYLSEDGKHHVYIVDFVDNNNKILFEIKPSKLKNKNINEIKFKAAEKWCIENGYTFEVISEDFFSNRKNDIIKMTNNSKIIKALKSL